MSYLYNNKKKLKVIKKFLKSITILDIKMVPPDPHLVRDISDYTASAEKLEATRQDLMSRIKGVVKEEIIPKVNSLLPEGYSVNPTDFSVSGGATHGAVPTGFDAILMLNYDGKPIEPDFDEGEGYDKSIEQIDEIRKDIWGRLVAISQEYGLNFLQVQERHYTIFTTA